MVIFTDYKERKDPKKSNKKKKKISYGTFSLAVFLFPVIKRAEKVSVFFFP